VRSPRYQSGAELRHLYTFLAVAEQASFRRAAAILGVAQPAISRTVKELEEAIGAPLFDRGKRQIALTVAGQHLYDRLPTVLRNLDGLLTATLEAARSRDVLRLGYSPAATEAFVRPWLDTRGESAGRVVLTEGRSSELIDRLEKGELDACVALFAPQSAGWRVTSLARDRLGLALRADDPLAQDETVAWASLANEPLIAFERALNPPLHDRILATCLEAGFTARIEHCVSPRSTAIMLVRAGEGIATVTESLAHLCKAGIVWRPLEPSLVTELLGIERDDETPSIFAGLLAAPTPNG